MHRRAEGDVADLARCDVEPPDPAADAHQHRLVTWQEAEARQQVGIIAAILAVPVDREGDPFVLAGLQIAEPEAVLLALPAGISEQLAVMRQRRAHRPAGRLDDRLVLSALEVAARDRPVGQVILGPGMAALGRIIEIAAIGRRDRAHGVHLRVPIVGRSCLGDLDAAAAVTVIHEQLERQDRMDRARDIDRAAIGRPGRRGIDGERLVLRQLLEASAIDIGDPEIGDAGPVGEEGELFAVG